MSALQWIVKEAKKLKKEYPKRFTTWKEYVAQASAIYAKKHKGKSPVGKKKVGAVKKKVAVKKKAAPKKRSSYHKDTKSHNVNIRVISGFDSLKRLQAELKAINESEKQINSFKRLLLNDPKNERYKYYLLHHKRIILAAKKNIKKIKAKI